MAVIPVVCSKLLEVIETVLLSSKPLLGAAAISEAGARVIAERERQGNIDPDLMNSDVFEIYQVRFSRNIH